MCNGSFEFEYFCSCYVLNCHSSLIIDRDSHVDHPVEVII